MEVVHLTLDSPPVVLSTGLQLRYISDVVASTATFLRVVSVKERATTNYDGGILTVSHRANISCPRSHKRSDAVTSLLTLGLLNVTSVSSRSQLSQYATNAAAPTTTTNPPPPRPAPKPHPTTPYQSIIANPNRPRLHPVPEPRSTGL
jgi:hypothetical protein